MRIIRVYRNQAVDSWCAVASAGMDESVCQGISGLAHLAAGLGCGGGRGVQKCERGAWPFIAPPLHLQQSIWWLQQPICKAGVTMVSRTGDHRMGLDSNICVAATCPEPLLCRTKVVVNNGPLATG